MKNNNKKTQLGMDPSTAANRLRIDILFSFVKKAGYKCYRCGKSLNRKTFSIDHKKPWLHSANPKARFFNLNNIAFSHFKCNSKAGQRRQSTHGSDAKYHSGCRCRKCKDAHATCARLYYSPKYRRQRYLKNGL